MTQLTEFKLPPPVDLFEAQMIGLDQVECPVIHRFSPGVYIRELQVPAGTFLIGHRQRTTHLNVFLQGRVTMFGDDGTLTELRAPMIFTAPPGRKCGYIHEDMVWLNVYPTDETDVEKLEEMFFDKSEVWKKAKDFRDANRERRMEDVGDYLSLLDEYGITEEFVRLQTENEDDQTPMPLGGYGISIENSNIQGKGVFATAPFKPGEIIAPVRLGDKRTPVGRYTNHSKTPNAKMEWYGEDIYLVALEPIRGNNGGFPGDEITTDYRENLRLIGVERCQEQQ